ncbi:hypothetical protein AGMMS50276_10500 [Synergistales bacterium]|nr:hypothetical protein AGMMS50276_10500 [Synergistales bacterium]
MTLPDGFAIGVDSLNIFAEEINADNVTDFAGNFIKISIVSAETAPIGVACATSANDDGKITNVDDSMEYRASHDTIWARVAPGASEITGLPNGDYDVRAVRDKVRDGVVHMASDTVKTVTVAAYSGSGPNPSPNPNPPTPDPYPDPTPLPVIPIPTDITVTLNEASYRAERQADGTYLIVLPSDTDVSYLKALKLAFTLPSGASMSPANGSAQDFSNGPVLYTITARGGTTESVISVAVRIEPPTVVERQYFSTVPFECEILYTLNEDGTVTARLLIPFEPGRDPAKVDAMFSGMAASDVSYAYALGMGEIILKATPRRASVAVPYLRIKFNVSNFAALKKGALSKIGYWLKGDNAAYVQTYSQMGSAGMKFSDIPMTKTPHVQPEETRSGESKDSGCNAGFGLLSAAGLLVLNQKRGQKKGAVID